MGIHSTHKQVHPLNSPNLRVDHPVAIFKSSTSKPLIPKPPNHHQHIINMRFTIASVAIMAGAVAAVPQYSVQPISQISDGQIQAPPATSAVGSAVPLPSPSALSSAADMTSTLAVTETASVTSVVVVPTATPVGPSGSMVTPIVGGNSTASATGSAAVSSTASSEESATSGVAGSSTESASAPESTGAAAGNMVSFGGLVFAIGAAVFA